MNMNTRNTTTCTAGALALVVSGSVSLAGGHTSGPAEPGEELMMAACVQCHSPRSMLMTRDGRTGWQDTIEKMVVIGAQLTTEEIDTLADYMARHYGPGETRMQTGSLPPGAVADADSSESIALPAGDGRELVQGLCSTCHDLGRVVGTRRSEDSWRGYTINMLAQGDVAADERQVTTVVRYLSTHFGK